MFKTWFPFLSVLFAVYSSAQDVHEDMDVNLVNVYLSATDSNGQFIKDLKAGELLLKENGTPQNISHFSNFTLDESNKIGEKDVPLTLAFVIDKSESMSMDIQGTNKMDIVKNAAFRMLDELRSVDRAMLISFNDMPSEEST